MPKLGKSGVPYHVHYLIFLGAGIWRKVLVTDYLIGADQNFSDCSDKTTFLKLKTGIRLRIKTWFGDLA